MTEGRNLLFLLLLVLFSCNFSQAQYLDYGVGVGQAVYWGDLNAPDFKIEEFGSYK